MELSQKERKLAEASARNRHIWFCKKSQYIEWVGVALFVLSFLPTFPAAEGFLFLLGSIGFSMLFFSFMAQAMSLIGKLYERVQKLEHHLKDHDI